MNLWGFLSYTNKRKVFQHIQKRHTVGFGEIAPNSHYLAKPGVLVDIYTYIRLLRSELEPKSYTLKTIYGNSRLGSILRYFSDFY